MNLFLAVAGHGVVPCAVAAVKQNLAAQLHVYVGKKLTRAVALMTMCNVFTTLFN